MMQVLRKNSPWKNMRKELATIEYGIDTEKLCKEMNISKDLLFVSFGYVNLL